MEETDDGRARPVMAEQEIWRKVVVCEKREGGERRSSEIIKWLDIILAVDC